MTQRRVQFASERINGKERVRKEVREYDVDKIGPHSASSQVGIPAEKQLRLWINKTEWCLRYLNKKIVECETLNEYEEYLCNIIKTLEYQLDKIEKHRSLCKKRGRVSIYTDKNTYVPEVLLYVD